MTLISNDLLATRQEGTLLCIEIYSHFRDELWSRFGGELATTLSDANIRDISIDFSETQWADPAPLLSLLCLLYNFKCQPETNVSFSTNIGFHSDENRYKFLGFLSSSGFLSAFAQLGEIWMDGEPQRESDIQDQLKFLGRRLAYTNSECIGAYIFNTSTIQSNVSRDEIVERLVAVAHRIGVSRWFPTNSPQRGILLHRIRTLLTECIDNIAEHAYLSEGHGAIFARIRPGIPDSPSAFKRWHRHWQDEKFHCPMMKRCNWKREPGWLELFICDAGVGLPTRLVKNKKSPLLSLAQKLFSHPISRFNSDERRSMNKTKMTGLQHLGHILCQNNENLGDFVRIYSNGEWIGEHLPWSRIDGLTAGVNFRRSAPPPGTLLHFSIEPPSADLADQRKLFPSYFVGHDEAELTSIINGLRENSPASFPVEFDFIDLHVGVKSSQSFRGVSADKWIYDIKAEYVFIRPPRNLRKNDLLYQIFKIISIRRPKAIFFIDTPASIAIDIAIILNGDPLRDLDKGSQFSVFIVTNEWFTSCFRFGGTKTSRTSKELAHAFLVGRDGKSAGHFVAKLLRDRDSEIFWENVGDSFINEYVIWNASGRGNSSSEFEVAGYLDLTLALSKPDCLDASKRSMRRAIAPFRNSQVITTDHFVRSVLDGHQRVSQPEPSADKGAGTGSVMTVSVLTSGGTSARFTERGKPNAVGVVALLNHPDGQLSPQLSSDPLIALRWIRPEAPPLRHLRPYKRIPNTSFILRGGEREIPLPRFKESLNDKIGDSLYGETPNVMYRRWQTQGLIRLGHWTYANRHDLLSINLADALEMDRADVLSIPKWFIDWIDARRMEDENRSVLVVYPSHPVSDKLADLIRRQSSIELFPLISVRPSAISPMIISPVERENIAKRITTDGRSVLFIFLDDAIVSRSSLTQTTLFIEGLWATLKRRGSLPDDATVEVRSIALLDRSGLPMQRDIVVRDESRHSRFWRWDVPTLGHENSCPVCGALERVRDLSHQLLPGALTKRMQHWLDFWKVIPVESMGFDKGLKPSRFARALTTRFYIDPRNENISHVVKHYYSTSRAAMSVEITRSTTRKDHALFKVREALISGFKDIDWQTAVEILCSQLLLFRDEFDFVERAERVDTLLRLIWSINEANPSTALASIVLLGDLNVMGQNWNTVSQLIELNGFPNEDALIVASLYVISVNAGIERNNTSKAWSMLKLVSAKNNDIRSALCRIAQIVGWDAGSVHRNALVNIFRKNDIVASEHMHMLISLELLSLSLSKITIDMTASAGISLRAHINLIDSCILEIRKLISVYLGVDSDQVDNNVSVFIEKSESDEAAKLAYNQIRQKLYSAIFVGEASVYIFFKRFFVELEENCNKGLLVNDAIRFIHEEWTAKRLSFSDERGGIPQIWICNEVWNKKSIRIYLDALVVRGLVDIFSNVRHRSKPISCPWPNHSDYSDADMWVRCSPGPDGTGASIECVNAATIDPRKQGLQHTANTLHILGIGGSIESSYDERAALSYTKVFLPSVQALAWGK